MSLLDSQMALFNLKLNDYRTINLVVIQSSLTIILVEFQLFSPIKSINLFFNSYSFG